MYTIPRINVTCSMQLFYMIWISGHNIAPLKQIHALDIDELQLQANLGIMVHIDKFIKHYAVWNFIHIIFLNIYSNTIQTNIYTIIIKNTYKWRIKSTIPTIALDFKNFSNPSQILNFSINAIIGKLSLVNACTTVKGVSGKAKWIWMV